MQIDIPDVVAEVRTAFETYEQALVTNDVATLDEIVRDDRRTIRYGQSENLYGYKEIEAFRAARPSAGLARTLSKTVITTFGRDVAMASTLFHRTTAPGKIGCAHRTIDREHDADLGSFAKGWRIVVGHVSVIEEPAD